jgi:hypothetical protein
MVSRYIHLNPVKVGKMRNKAALEQLSFLWKYEWSSLPVMGVIEGVLQKTGKRYSSPRDWRGRLPWSCCTGSEA